MHNLRHSECHTSTLCTRSILLIFTELDKPGSCYVSGFSALDVGESKVFVLRGTMGNGGETRQKCIATWRVQFRYQALTPCSIFSKDTSRPTALCVICWIASSPSKRAAVSSNVRFLVSTTKNHKKNHSHTSQHTYTSCQVDVMSVSPGGARRGDAHSTSTPAHPTRPGSRTG